MKTVVVFMIWEGTPGWQFKAVKVSQGGGGGREIVPLNDS